MAARRHRKRKSPRTPVATESPGATGSSDITPQATATAEHLNARITRYAWWLMLALVLAVSVFLRVSDYTTWQQHQDRYFFEGDPVLLNADGYHYLRLARDYRDGQYAPIDELRTTPEHPPRPLPVPLLSWVTAAVSAASPLSLAWAAALLPVFLALFTAIPLLMICRQLRIPPFASLVALLVALSAQWFVTRTRLGAYDTDCMIVAFALGAQAAALGFGLCQDRRRYVYLLGAAVNAALFAWWWDQTPETVALICLTPLLISAACYYRPPRREALAAGGLTLLALAALALAAGEHLAALGRNIWEVLFAGVKGGGDAAIGFPNVATDIAELDGFDWRGIVSNTTAFIPTLALGIIGLAWLFCAQPKAAFTALTVPVLLAVSAFYFGQRGFLFWGPPLGIGIAFVLVLIARFITRIVAQRFTSLRIPGYAITACILATGATLAIVPALMRELDSSVLSPRVTHTIPVIRAIRAHTPPDALLWAPWPMGYALMYYTGRRVIMDGQYMSGERQVYGNMPLANSDPAFARNFIRFYAQRGLTGLRRINQLAGSTDAGLSWMREWFGKSPEAAAHSLHQLAANDNANAADLATIEASREFLFPDNTESIFLLIYHEQLQNKWFWYGTWDAARETGELPAHLLFLAAQRQGDMITTRQGFSFNVNEGKNTRLTVNGETIRKPINKFITYTGRALEEQDYGHPGGLHFEWVAPAGFGMLMTEEIAASVANQLFIRHTMNPAYFRAAYVQSPAVSLWEVGVAPRTP